MIIFYDPFKKFLHLLLKHEVDFILIGGYAVNYYGFNRPTGDMDIWLRPDALNKERFINVLSDDGFSNKSVQVIRKLDFTTANTFFLGEVPLRIDFLTRISGVDFSDAWEQKEFLPLGNDKIPVLQLHHLILSKISNDRLKDKIDVEELQKIQAKKKK